MIQKSSIRTAYMTPLPEQPTLSLMGPVARSLASAEETNDQLSVLDSFVAAGVVVPLHSHAEVECAYVLEGTLQILTWNEQGHAWMNVSAGQSVVVPSNAPHAIRNVSGAGVRLLMISDGRLGRFFEEMGRPIVAGEQPSLPSPEWVQSLMELSARYGYWLGSPEENAAVGITF